LYRFIQKCLNILERRPGDDAIACGDAHPAIMPVKGVNEKTDG